MSGFSNPKALKINHWCLRTYNKYAAVKIRAVITLSHRSCDTILKVHLHPIKTLVYNYQLVC